MLKHKLMLPILAVIAGVAASAFTVSPVTATKGNATEYWFSNLWGPLHYDGIQSKASEEVITGCTDVTIPCARGYVANQLKNPNDPSQGPQNINIYTENLNKSN